MEPSKVTYQPWIYARTTEAEEQTSEDISQSHCGKWMIFNDNTRFVPKLGMTYHDHAWTRIKKLIESNSSSVIGLLDAKASTAWTDGYKAEDGCTDGVICCYTTCDSNDMSLVKQAADAIRKVYYYPKDMLFKSNEDTYAGKYRHMGSKYVSIYKHSVKNEMYERDCEDPSVWNIVNVGNSFDEESEDLFMEWIRKCSE